MASNNPVKQIARQLLAKTLKEAVEEYAGSLRNLRAREVRQAEKKGALKKSGSCPLCGNEDKPGACTCSLAKFELSKNATMGYGAGTPPPSPPGGMGMMKEELCKACGKGHAMGKCSMDDVKPGKELGKEEMGDAGPSCPRCRGMGMHLGNLGNREHFRCRGCGTEFSIDGAPPESAHEKLMEPEPKVLHPADKKTTKKEPDPSTGSGSAKGEQEPPENQSEIEGPGRVRDAMENPQNAKKTEPPPSVGTKKGELVPEAGKKVAAPGSGGQIKKGKALAKSEPLRKDIGAAQAAPAKPTARLPGMTPPQAMQPKASPGMFKNPPVIPGRSAAGVRGTPAAQMKQPGTVDPQIASAFTGASPDTFRGTGDQPHPETAASLAEVRQLGNAKASQPHPDTVASLAAVKQAGAAKVAASRNPAQRPSPVQSANMTNLRGKLGDIQASREGAAPTSAPARNTSRGHEMADVGASDAANLAADKKAGGVGWLNSLVSKFKGAGNATWDAMRGTGPTSAGRAARTAGSRMALSEKPAVEKVLKKNGTSALGNCALCGCAEHPGVCTK